MSLTYSFTDHATIQISCGDTTIEVTIPQVVATTTAPADPPAEGPAPHDASISPVIDMGGGKKKERKPVPKGNLEPVYPGTMLVVAKGKMPEGHGLFLEDTPGSLLDLSDLENQSDADILSMIKDQAGLAIIDLLVDHPVESNSRTMRRLSGFMDDPAFPLDALRMWKK